MDSKQARSLHTEAALARLAAANDALLRRAANGGGRWAYVHIDDALSGLTLRDELAALYQSRGYQVEVTHRGIGLKVSF